MKRAAYVLLTLLLLTLGLPAEGKVPASTLVQISRLAYPELLVEIEAVAVCE